MKLSLVPCLWSLVPGPLFLVPCHWSLFPGPCSLSPFAVVEVHQGWCGPCKAIVGTFQRISIDMSDSPLKFYRANCDKVEQLGKYVGQCQPVFLFYKGGVVVEEVVGVDTPMLTSKIKSLV